MSAPTPQPSALRALSVERRTIRATLRAGRTDEARALLEGIWERARVLPIDVPEDGADLFQQLAEDFARIGDAPRALAAGTRGLAIEDGLQRPALRRSTLMFLATLHARGGDRERALVRGREALAMYEADLGPDHSEVRSIRDFLRRNGAP